MYNIVICGTPGTGKSTLVEKIKPDLLDFNFINLSEFAIKNDCIDGFDEILETQIIDEDKLLEKLVPVLKQKLYNIIECIHADMIPPDLVDEVFVLRTCNTILYDRLQKRGYNEKKICNNVESEIFQLVHDEAVEAFGSEKVHELVNEKEDQLSSNATAINDKIHDYMSKNKQTNAAE